uniref:Uncharacterized protein n=1 Tax=Arundo donax TaxID=35708 RepID=A0A0A9CJE9_ARUDO
MMGYITSLSCSQFLRLATDSIYAPNFVIFLSQQSQSCYL